MDLKDHLVPAPCHGQGHLPVSDFLERKEKGKGEGERKLEERRACKDLMLLQKPSNLLPWFR